MYSHNLTDIIMKDISNAIPQSEVEFIDHLLTLDPLKPLLCDRWVALSAMQKSIRRGDSLTAQRALRCFVPDFDGAFLSSDSRDALWDRFYTGAPQRQSGCVPRQAFRGRHGV